MLGLGPIGDFFAHPLARAMVWLALIILMLAGAIQLFRRMRMSVTDEAESSSEILTNFREMHAEGRLSDEEYRHIKRRLIEKLQTEISENDDSG